MFLVELSHTTIKEEIETLDYKAKRKAIALKDSGIQLDHDNNKLMKFIEEDNITTNNKEKEADKQMGIRKKKEIELKSRDQKIQNLKSEIEKFKGMKYVIN